MFLSSSLSICVMLPYLTSHPSISATCRASLGTKTPNGRYFHFRHLMNILVLIWAYHRTYFYLFFDTFKGSELIIRRICFLRIEEKTIDYKKKK
jgi:hypothetical protein